ncbi:MAG: hypothetical protein LBR28_03425 [Bacteroidales bacterium]|nr:hypothetical protein [Bacteroidales bacterium]
MKKVLIFFAGFVVGVLATFLLAYELANKPKSNDDAVNRPDHTVVEQTVEQINPNINDDAVNKPKSNNDVVNKSNYDLRGLTLFSEKGECIKPSPTKKSFEIEIKRVLKPNMALGYIKGYNDKKHYDGEVYRDYDYTNEVEILLINNDGKTYYDNQKIDVSKKCCRQIGTYKYSSNTVPAVIIE